MISYLKLELIFLISSSLCFSACVRLYCSVLNAEHTAARRRLLERIEFGNGHHYVSTHSRAEAAALTLLTCLFAHRFQHTAARRRLPLNNGDNRQSINCFNTQPRGGGCFNSVRVLPCPSCFNTQPRGGGCLGTSTIRIRSGGFNTQPRGGGCLRDCRRESDCQRFQHTAARRRLRFYNHVLSFVFTKFQHTAARRRLRHCINTDPSTWRVSTHSRAEAAARATLKRSLGS